MPPIIIDANLGSRFWKVADLSQVNVPENLNADPENESVQDVKHDSTVVTFVNSDSDPMAKSAIERAEFFAASHAIAEDEAAEAREANAAAYRLIGEDDAVDAFIDDVVDEYIGLEENEEAGLSAADLRPICLKAFRKLLLTKEFQERSRVKVDQFVGRDGELLGDVEYNKLGKAGLAALKNATMGLVDMLRKGKISDNAILVLADEKYYDASNRADMLRLAADSAKKVKELFVGKARFDALIAQCEECLARAVSERKMTPQQEKKARDGIAKLRTLAASAIGFRRAAVEGIKSEFHLTDPTGKVKSDEEFQRMELDKIRDSLRAFRYDLDKLTGKHMGVMERLRRRFDEMRSSVSSDYRITEERLDVIKEADALFDDLLGRVQRQVADGAQDENMGKQDEYAKALSSVVKFGSKSNLKDAIAASTKLAHITNNRIRYHYSGAEEREKANFEAISDELGAIAEEGGSRTVSLKMSADALFKLGILGQEVKANAGAMFEVSAQITTDNAGGTVSITYTRAGGVQAGASTKFGADPEAKGGEGGIGVKVSAKAEGKVAYSVTKTYANLEEAARTMSKLNILMTPRPREAFYAWGKAAIRGIGHVFVLGATMLGFRIHRSRMDQLEYGAEIRNRNVLGESVEIFRRKRNVEFLEDRKTWSVQGSLSARADGGLYVPDDEGEDEMKTNIAMGFGLEGSYSRDLSVKGRIYTSFAKNLSFCSTAHLEKLYGDELNSVADQGWKRKIADKAREALSVSNMHGFNPVGIREELSSLGDLLVELEHSAAGKKPGDKAFWDQFAAKARIFAVVLGLLAKRAEGLDGATPGAAEAKQAAVSAVNYLLPRIANPGVEIPSDIYLAKFYEAFDLTGPRRSQKSLVFSFQVDAFGKVVDDFKDDKGIGDETTLGNSVKNPVGRGAANIAGAAGGPAVSAGTDIAKDTLGLAGSYEMRVTHDTKVSKHKDLRPWMNGDKTIYEVRLHANLPLRVIVDAIVRRQMQSMGGLSERDAAKWRQEFIDGLVDGLKNGAEDVAIASASRIMDLPFLQAAKKYPVLGQMVGGIDFLNKIRDDGVYEFKDATYKTLKFEIGDDGRLSSFTLQEDYDTEGKISVSPLPFLGITGTHSSKTVNVDWSVMPRPTPGSLMKRAMDFAGAGNPEGFANLLNRNKKGVVRLMKAGMADFTAVEAPEGDSYWAKDVASMKTVIGECLRLVSGLADKGGTLGGQARALALEFRDICNDFYALPSDADDQAMLDLAARFFTATAKIYTLNAMAAKG